MTSEAETLKETYFFYYMENIVKIKHLYSCELFALLSLQQLCDVNLFKKPQQRLQK